jgi:23S rRNA (uracil1939-C5)-methyltransferase
VPPLTPGQDVELAIEKPAAGGRMIARLDGQVVLVSGAVPGERVLARIERTEKRLAFASVVDVREPSPDRRPGFADASCGGCVYSHIGYARQLALKADIVRDAFFRLGRLPIDAPIPVAPSPERGYRTRARFHVDGSRVGFYREGTHTLCDAAATGQVSDAGLAAVSSAVSLLAAAGARVASIELAESIDARQRVVALTLDDVRRVPDAQWEAVNGASGVTACAAQDAAGRRVEAGDPWILDPLATLTMGRVEPGALRHRPEAFFQANRFLLPELVGTVLDAVEPDGTVLDLYAGVGLFSVALAATERRDITAVEGDRVSGADLRHNAHQASLPSGGLTAVLDSIERYLQRRPRGQPIPGTVIVDPPRTGMSAEVVGSIVALGAPRIVYVACDPPTMARDARRLIDGGYRLESLRAFDLFPNTPHVEVVGVFVRGS